MIRAIVQDKELRFREQVSHSPHHTLGLSSE